MQVVHPDTSTLVQIGYGAFISLAHLVWFGLVAVFLSTDVIRERVFKVRHVIDRVFGALLVSCGLAIASASLSGD